ncbi:MAG: AmmeMemoRadiSam system protein A [Clostridia bacterium]|nr:AmmeMemoRadiSam system protein A [Clostridia bacterium]MBN2883234.1 AmmeMemoRadiSam system protein A [Clostridia bacterium]
MDYRINGFIMPHPPIILPAIGKGEEKRAFATIDGCRTITGEIERLEPETIVVITPHGPVFRDAVCLNTDKTLSGSFKKFGHSEIKFTFPNDTELTENFLKSLENASVPAVKNNQSTAKRYSLDREIDHGVLVPLFFIQERYSNFKLVHLTYGTIGPEKLYSCGMALREAIMETGRKTVVIASSDLSHKLKKEGPYEFNPDGPVYDELVVKTIGEGDFAGFLGIDDKIRNNAGECGHRSITILLGLFEDRKTSQEVHSYEGPFGVGYMTASIHDEGPASNSVIDEYILKMADIKKEAGKNESEYVKLARKTIEEYVKNGYIIAPGKTSEIKKGVFVSIKKHGSLRGCIGTISPTTSCVEKEIINNAISASTRDPRFNPIEEWELDDLEISVDLLHEPEPIKSMDELNVLEYGVIVRSGYKSGLLLPNLEGIDTVEEQVSIALRKAGINRNEKYEMERFRVERFK